MTTPNQTNWWIWRHPNRETYCKWNCKWNCYLKKVKNQTSCETDLNKITKNLTLKVSKMHTIVEWHWKLIYCKFFYNFCTRNYIKRTLRKLLASNESVAWYKLGDGLYKTSVKWRSTSKYFVISIFLQGMINDWFCIRSDSFIPENCYKYLIQCR